MLKQMLLALLIAGPVFAATNAGAVWEHVHQAFSGAYVMYGGWPTADEAKAPSPGDSKVAFNLGGNAARDMFNAIGPDLTDVCPTAGLRVRQRNMLLCRYRSQDGYACNFGFDLSTGLIIGGAIGGNICQT